MVPGHEIVGNNFWCGFQSQESSKWAIWLPSAAWLIPAVNAQSCKAGEEQYCDRSETIWTYQCPRQARNLTFGGYGNQSCVTRHSYCPYQKNLDPAAAAPCCARITTYSPLKHWEQGTGKKIGVVGLGGLGHMALKSLRLRRADVQFTTSANKVEDAKKLARRGHPDQEAGWHTKHPGPSTSFSIASPPDDITPTWLC